MSGSEKRCRICLKKKRSNKLIYEYVKNKYLPSIIEAISGVKISALKEPFCAICSNCSSNILQAEVTIWKCRESNKLLMEHQQLNNTQQCISSEDSVNERCKFVRILKKKRTAEPEPEVTLKINQNEEVVNAVQKQASAAHDEEITVPRFDDSIESSNDEKDEADKLSKNLKKCTSTKRKRKVTTSNAPFNDNESRKYVRTVNINKNFFFQCDQCEFSSHFATYFREHLQQQHKIAKPRFFKCTQCDRCFSENRYLKQHIAYQHEQQPQRRKFLCSECGKGFTKSNHLDYHQRCHLPKEQRPVVPLVTCEQCNKQFRKHSISMHMKNMHAPERSFVCALCRSCFALEKCLQSHMKVCHPSEIFVCPCCEVKFRVRSVYETHVQRGTCQKLDFNCDYCAWGFKKQDRLERHKIQVHKELMQQLSERKCNAKAANI